MLPLYHVARIRCNDGASTIFEVVLRASHGPEIMDSLLMIRIINHILENGIRACCRVIYTINPLVYNRVRDMVCRSGYTRQTVTNFLGRIRTCRYILLKNIRKIPLKMSSKWILSVVWGQWKEEMARCVIDLVVVYSTRYWKARS